MEKIKAILNPGAKADDDVLYGQGTTDNTGKVAGEGSHFGHSRTTAGTTGSESAGGPDVANAAGCERDVNDASSTTATKGGIPGATQPATHTESPNAAAATASEGAVPGDRYGSTKALASSRAGKGPQDNLQPDENSGSVLGGGNQDYVAAKDAGGSSIDNRHGPSGTQTTPLTGGTSRPQDTISSSNPYSSAPIDPRVDPSRSSTGKDHHIARDAALGGTAAGAGYAAKKHHDEKAYDSQDTTTGSHVPGSFPTDTTDTTNTSTGYHQPPTSTPAEGPYGPSTGSSAIGTTATSSGDPELATSVSTSHPTTATGGYVPLTSEDGRHIDTYSDSSRNIAGSGYHTSPIGTAVTSNTPQQAQYATGATGGSHDPKSEHSHYGRDAALGAGVVGAAGAGHEAKEHHDHSNAPQNVGGSNNDSQRQPVESGMLSGSGSANQQYPGSRTGATGSTAPTNTGIGQEPESQHHYGRDAAILGGTEAATGLGAHEYSTRKDHNAAETQTQQPQYPTSHVKTTETFTPPTTAASVPSTTSAERQPDSQHYYGRDVAVLGGTGAATGLAAHEYQSHKGHASQQDPPTTTATQIQYPTSTPAQSNPQEQDHHYGRDAAAVAGAGTAAGVAAHEHDSKKKQQELEKQEKAHEKEVKAQEKEHEKEVKKEEKEHEKQIKHEQKEQEKQTKHEEKEHEKQLKHEQKEQEKQAKHEEKEHEKQLKQEQKEKEKSRKADEHKSGGILGFLHRDKKDKDDLEEEKHDSHKKELAGAGVAGAGGTALAEHEHNKHKAETESGIASTTQTGSWLHDSRAATAGTGIAAVGSSTPGQYRYDPNRAETQPTSATMESAPYQANNRNFPLSGTTATTSSALHPNETDRAHSMLTEDNSHEEDALAAGAVGAGGAAFAGHEHNKYKQEEIAQPDTNNQGAAALPLRGIGLRGKEGGAPGATGVAPEEYNAHNYQQRTANGGTNEPHTTHNQTATETDTKEEKKSHGLLGFLHRDKHDKDAKDETEPHHSHEKEAAAATGVAGVAGVAEHEHDKHGDRNRLHKVCHKTEHKP